LKLIAEAGKSVDYVRKKIWELNRIVNRFQRSRKINWLRTEQGKIMPRKNYAN